MVQAKGSTLRVRLAFLKEKGNADDLERVLAELGPEARTQIEKGVPAGDWYPFQTYVELSRAIDRVLGTGDLSLIVELGRHSAEVGARRMYRAFTKVGSPEHIFRHAAAVWHQFFSAGELHVVEDSPNTFHLIVEGFDEAAREHCLSVVGWLQGNVELSGAKDVHIEERQCRSWGDEQCDFVVTWTED